MLPQQGTEPVYRAGGATNRDRPKMEFEQSADMRGKR